MEQKRFVKGKDAVSPVIGVILMIAITVVLAAVLYLWLIGYFVPKAPPSITFTPEAHKAYFTVKIESVGEDVSIPSVDVLVRSRTGEIKTPKQPLTEWLGETYPHGFVDGTNNGVLDGTDVFYLIREGAQGVPAGTGYEPGDSLVLVFRDTASTMGAVELPG
jgi:flagellin-like protein